MMEVKDMGSGAQKRAGPKGYPGRIVDWAKAHPRLAAWIGLAAGMDAMVAYEARDVGLLAGQWIGLVIATTLVAGLCIWIIGWDDEEEVEEQEKENGKEKA